MTPETKAQIEQQAKNMWPKRQYVIEWDEACRKSYIAGATPYAEKWEAAEKENKDLREALEKVKRHCLATGPKRELRDRVINDILSVATEALKPKQ